jgi:hypothetical protein
MPYKPVGIDENSHFPPRVRAALAEEFVTKPEDIAVGQVRVWDAVNHRWIAGDGGSGGGAWDLPPAIDGGVWDPVAQAWVHGSGNWNSPPEIDGGTPFS